MLEALSSLDGRYAKKTEELQPYFSEASLISYRLHVEVQWLLHLLAWQEKSDLDFKIELSSIQKEKLMLLSHEVLKNHSFAQRVKEFEKQTNHDVKAVEYTLAEHLRKEAFSDKILSLIHFACTSEDINNLAYALLVRDAVQKTIVPHFEDILQTLTRYAHLYKNLSMVSRTHGQKASPTTLGKELGVFVYRLRKQLDFLREHKLTGKINGATGHYCAHALVFPHVNWEELAREFVCEKLQLRFHPMTTQIEPHDTLVELCQTLTLASSIFIDLCRDMWGYISWGYLRQKLKESEIGSSTMPHKVNPIDFENAEGNFGLGIALAQHMAVKLPISRFQRDLSDSTVLRSLGSLFGYVLIGLLALKQGLGKIEAEEKIIAKDLDESWELLGEALQTALRACGVSDAYERIKKATHGQCLEQKEYLQLVEEAKELGPELQTRLRNLRPSAYVGLASELVSRHCPL